MELARAASYAAAFMCPAKVIVDKSSAFLHFFSKPTTDVLFTPVASIGKVALA